MKVAFNAMPLSAPQLRGWTRYTLNLLEALADEGVALTLYAHQPLNPAYLERLRGSGARSVQVREAPRGLRYLDFEQRWLPWQCARDGVDVLHAPHNFGLPLTSPCVRVLTLHDVIDRAFGARPSVRQRLSRAALQSRLHHWVAYRRAHHVLTVSEHARRDIIHHLGVAPERITAVLEAADPRFLAPLAPGEGERVRRAHALERPFLFYVGGWEERKNLPFLVRAFAEARLAGVELVLAGGNEAHRVGLATLAAELGVGERLKLLGFVPDEDLPALYAEARCFVYPSLYEGFGLQLCEAMAQGCPVLAADATSLPEVLGEGGALFPLDSTGPLAALLREVCEAPTRADDLRARARTRARQLSWQRTARGTLEVYERLLRGR